MRDSNVNKRNSLTQNEMVWNYLRENPETGITWIDAFKLFGISALNSRISNLKKQGHRIYSQYETSPNKFGVKVKYKRYTLRKPKPRKEVSKNVKAV